MRRCLLGEVTRFPVPHALRFRTSMIGARLRHWSAR